MGENAKTAGVMSMAASFQSAAKYIKGILTRNYKMSAADAEAAISASPLKNIFEQDAEMASHTSNEAWARNVYKYWQGEQEPH